MSNAIQNLMGLGLAPALATALGLRDPSTATIFGGSSAPTQTQAQLLASFLDEGNIYREVVASRNPASTGSDYVLGVFTLPAYSFDVAGRGINLLAQGSVANNTNTKTIKLYMGATSAVVGSVISGGTVIASTGAYSTTGAAGWSLEANVFKYGATGSNTQLALHMSAQVGNTVGSLIVPSALTLTESATITMAVTGNAATTATDIIYNFFEVNAMN